MDATDEPGAVLRSVRSAVAGPPSVRHDGRVPRGGSGRKPPTRADAHGVAEQVRRTLEAIDYPAFVADLLRGTFDAKVAVSIEQMEAYGDLLDEVTKVVDDYVTAEAAPHASPQRQRLLATMVLMGINRTVVTDGRIRPRPDDD